MLFKKRLLIYIFLNKLFFIFSTLSLMLSNNTNSFSNSLNLIIYRRDLISRFFFSFSFFLNKRLRFEIFNSSNRNKDVSYIKLN